MKTLNPFVALSLALTIAACSRQTAAPESPVEIDAPATVDISVALQAGGTYRYERGLLSVPENRERADSRRFDLEFHRLPKTNPDSQVPTLFILKGGPGYTTLEEDLAKPGYYEYFFEHLTALTDVVIVGQRGFGNNNALPCPDMPEATIDQVDTPEERFARIRAGMKACKDLHEANGADLSGYNIVQMAEDVADVAKALGYTKVQLWGNSFGSHWAMALLRSHPSLVERVMLSALEGPDHTFDNPLEIEASLRRMARAAQADPELAPHLQDRNLMDDFKALVDRADQAPISVTWQPGDDAPIESFTINGTDLRKLSRGYSRGTHWRYLMPVWPREILELLDGQLEGGVDRLARWWLNPGLANAGYYSVECGSGASPARRSAMFTAEKNSVMAVHDLVAGDLCADWPSDLGESFRESYVTDIPALLMQGTWDTSVPLENSPSVRAMFTDHHFITIEGGSHGALREAEEAYPQFRAGVLAWLRSGETTGLPETVTLPAMEWALPEQP